MSMLAQSQLSVPPAPAVICNTADKLSSSLESIFLSSSSSISFSKVAYCALSSDSSAMPSRTNSINTSRSATAVAVRSKVSTQYLRPRMCFIFSSAFFGSSQKVGSWVLSSSSLSCIRFSSILRNDWIVESRFCKALYCSVVMRQS